MNGLDRWEAFVITRNGVPVRELHPARRCTFVSAEVALAAFAGIPRIRLGDLRRDLDEHAGQHVKPRA